jgi:hypothetical protein
MVQYGALALCDFLAKDEVGKNEVATAVATTARISFLVVFIISPIREGPDHVGSWPESLAQRPF